MKSTPLRLPLLALCGLLSACISLGETDDTGTSSGAAPSGRATGSSTRTTTALATPDARPVNDDPMQFLGLRSDDIAASLGAPDLIRRDGTAEVRQFHGSACTLDLFLYQTNGVSTVKHVELRGASLESDARRACLADLIRSRQLSS
ncbi:hypothetical protein HH303_10840 [Rhodospirillaceae bacterium KN72]|uniref:Lipoprotein n=1 Tax=Pacificispira spongiicola TaxID=2729598 RepID=A0A7Y0HEL1_9PROT|nr:hypothetical protein [Pacificispira spongiicola]NMM44976.1 hypothetical protein [Pacificispira spongiicola]